MKNFDSAIAKLNIRKLELQEGPAYTGLNRDMKRLNRKLKNLFKGRKYYQQSLRSA